MQFHESVVDLIGDTPLVRLTKVTGSAGPMVLAKLEQFNPGGSAKDRIALSMVTGAERSGLLAPGGTLVEPTSGNTGVGLALVAQQRGYRCVFTCPDKVSPDKIAVLRAYGAEVVVCPAAAPVDHPDFYRNVAIRLAAEIPGACRLDQYDNENNPAAHYLATGPEIWSQTDHRVTHFVAGVGTGGTISGTGRYLKEVSGGRVRVVGADPEGSVYSGGQARPYYVEGVGQPSLPGSYDPGVPDEIVMVSDRESVELTRRLAREEGILTGGSGGMAVAAALRIAETAEPDAVIVVLIPDSGRGYLSKMFSDDWLARFGFESSVEPGPKVCDVSLPDGITFLPPDETVSGALKIMRERGLGHLPVSAAPPPVRLPEIKGFVTEAELVRRAASGELRFTDAVAEHARVELPTVGWWQPVAEVADAVAGAGAALVLRDGLPAAVITPRDIAGALESHVDGDQ
ncbi:pyridoxal-phosphate dependent enzyme [Saccharopolyspora sp. NPDC003752]